VVTSRLAGVRLWAVITLHDDDDEYACECGKELAQRAFVQNPDKLIIDQHY